MEENMETIITLLGIGYFIGFCNNSYIWHLGTNEVIDYHNKRGKDES